MFVCLFISLHFYTDGQKIAKKLCAQIKKESREVLSMLVEYNAVQESPADVLCSSEAYDPCALRLRLQSLGLQTTGARLQERQEIMQAYLTLSRSIEEMELLKEDIKNVVSYYQKVKSVVLEEIENLSTKSDAVSRGDKALLHHF